LSTVRTSGGSASATSAVAVGFSMKNILPHTHDHVIIHVFMNDSETVKDDEKQNAGGRVRGDRGR
jgi:hypothetical protein